MASTSNDEKPSGDDSWPALSLRHRIIGFSDWCATVKDDSSSSEVSPVLDLREFREQQRRFLRPSTPQTSSDKLSFTVVPIPISEVEARSYELPARHVKFGVLLSEQDLDRANSFLSGSNRKRPNPWKVDYVLLDNEDFWSRAVELGIGCLAKPEEHETKRQRLENMNDGCTSVPCSSKIPTVFPYPRLWQPDPMVERILFPLLARMENKNSINAQNQSHSEVWDLAAGAGRDVAFLAEELVARGNPYQIVAVDHRYNEKETKVVNDFWSRRGTEDYTKSLKLNLSHWKTLEAAMASALKKNQVAAMFCVRFWKPELVESIAVSPTVSSGVVFALSHFCKPSIGAPWNFAHPSEKTVLERNQLRDLFQSNWEILHDAIALDSDHGRTMIHFVAKRK